MGVLILHIEIACHTVAVVCAYEIEDNRWEILLLCHTESLRNMAYDDLCALSLRDALVRVYASLILCEEDWMAHLSYIMI